MFKHTVVQSLFDSLQLKDIRFFTNESACKTHAHTFVYERM